MGKGVLLLMLSESIKKGGKLKSKFTSEAL